MRRHLLITLLTLFAFVPMLNAAHAGEDSPTAILSHTMLGDGFKIKLNGKLVPEES